MFGFSPPWKLLPVMVITSPCRITQVPNPVVGHQTASLELPTSLRELVTILVGFFKIVVRQHILSLPPTVLLEILAIPVALPSIKQAKIKASCTGPRRCENTAVFPDPDNVPSPAIIP